MNDREKVLKGLDALHKAMMQNQCYACSHEFIEVVKEFGTDIINDALELFKEQEPRVLTLKEVQNDCPDFVYLEIASGWIECCVKDEGESTKDVGYFVYGFGEYFIEAWKKYGATWRCWDNRPTDEQRKAVKWEND